MPPGLPDPVPGARHVATETASTADVAESRARDHARRLQLGRRIDLSASAVLNAESPLIGGLLLMLMLFTLACHLATSTVPSVSAGFWMALAGLVALALAVLPRWRSPKPMLSAALLTGLLATAAALVALAPWLATPDTAGAMALASAALGTAGTVALAARPPVAVAWSATPLAACMALATAEAWIWGLAGASGSAIALAAALRHRRHWRLGLQALIEQDERCYALERERDEALRTDAEKSRFLAIASHDLRQPVHALGLFAATLQRRLQHSPEEPLARNLVRAVDGLERSFSALLDISRLDAGGVAPRIETFALRDMFRRLHMHYAGQAELAGLGLRFSPGGRSVTSDPQLLERIVGNLIQNAIKYTSEGGIVVVARRSHGHVNIEVWDTGCGIAAGELPLIFDEFYQVGRGERDRSHGLGMGLAIVKRLAALMGHRLEVASTPGRGTLFRVGVPLGSLPGIQEDLVPADTQPMSIQSPRMVLVVDDEEPIREGLRLLLEEWGYQVTTAANAMQAEQVAAALEGHIDLILSDLHLGDGPDGTEVVAQVRRLCGHAVPALLITGDTSHEQLAPVIASGDPVLFKPVLPRRLFAALHDTLT